MRRTLLPLILIAIGIGLILAYLVLRAPAADFIGSGGPPDVANSGGVPGLPAAMPTARAQAPTATTAPTLTPSPSSTPQPIFPTPTQGAVSPASTISPTVEEITPVSPTATIEHIPNRCTQQDCLARFGVSGEDLELVKAAHNAGLPFSAYFNWWIDPNPPQLAGAEYWQVVGLEATGPAMLWEEIDEAVSAQPGSIWIVGNEPDVIWQDNLLAETYARLYHDVYTYIKERDPTAKLAIAGISQPTPLRLAYLDKILDSYQAAYGQPMPIDVWTIHGFILREEANSWGVGIPPGMEVSQGRLYELEDHNNLEIFGQNLIEFRVWMDERGYGNRPLALTEFGILHPSDYGFPPQVVADFMAGAFDFLLQAANETGYPADENRLIQWWFWYSVYDGGDFPTGNLYNPQNGQLTEVGEAFAAYVRGE